MLRYGYIGTDKIVYADEWNQPEGTVLVQSKKPGDNYVLDLTGNWEISPNVTKANEQASKARKESILKEWPIDKQLEALTENAMGQPEKLNQLIFFLKNVKIEYPKY